MTVFQWITISLLSALALSEVVGKLRGRRSGWVWLFRLTLWIAAAVGIADPSLVSRVAGMVGIQRGADLVSYVVALSFLAASFYFYSRYTALQKQLTQIVRHIAIAEAKRGGTDTPDADPTKQVAP
ncbi:MAG TPA: DUF2304 domain-containing protein [Pirellulaceae bacterium]|nr:DUF2304 domain-containing protein [Pirellulaceae bacterium]